MIQFAAMSAAKPAANGMDILAGMPAEGPVPQGFGAFLENRMEGDTTQAEAVAALSVAIGESLRQASGEVSGKAGGKILPAGLPLGLPVGLKIPRGKAEPVAIPSPAAVSDEPKAGEEVMPQAGIDPLALFDPTPLAIAQSAPGNLPQPLGDAPGKATSRGAHSPASHAPASSPLTDARPQIPRFSQAVLSVAAQPGMPAAGQQPVAPEQSAAQAGQPAPFAATLRTTIQATAPFAMPAEAIRLPAAEATGENVPATLVDPVAQTAAPVAVSGARIAASAGRPRNGAGRGAVDVPSDAVSGPAAPPLASVAQKSEPARPVAASSDTRQDMSGWFGQGAAPQEAAAATAGRQVSTPVAQTPHDFAALVDRLVEARQSAMPPSVFAAVRHAEFGNVSMKFEQDGAGLKVALSSPDPDFARAVQAAAPAERQGFSDNAGNSQGFAGWRQDAAASHSGGGAEPQSRQTGGNERQTGDARLRHASTQTGKTEDRKSGRDGIFA